MRRWTSSQSTSRLLAVPGCFHCVNVLRPPSRYLKDILSRTPDFVEQVTINPSGSWEIPNSNQNGDRKRKAPCDETNGDDGGSGNHYSNNNNDDGNDEIIISGSNVIGRTPSIPYQPTATSLPPPPSQSTPLHHTQTPTGHISHKRPMPQAVPAIIDLTLSSDDEDDEPIARPNKRIYLGR